ncbi:MAG: hypothetical protein MUO23_01950, partial [Anaerolineales bacterium]|nr:hypothetical protein [Anaerolineales bacterium]
YAWMATALLATQPLLFGHAFINQKDTPFMAFFLVSVAVGLEAADRVSQAIRRAGSASLPESRWTRLRGEWAGTSRSRRVVGIAYLIGSLLWLISLAAVDSRQPSMIRLMQAIGEGLAWERLQSAATSLARGASSLPTDTSLGTAVWLHDFGRMILLIGWIALAPVVVRWVLPKAFHEAKASFGWSLGWAVLAGALLGFTVSIRQIGVFAGLLVSLYWLRRLHAAGLWVLVIYLLAGAVVTLATWPYLWAAPLQRFWESLALGADFEIHMTPYRGQWVFSDRIPWHYFPTLASLELTIPAVALFISGIAIAGWRWTHQTIDRTVLGIVLLWLAAPLFGLIVLGMGAYNNIRQLHFALAPIFLIAGVGLSGLLMRVNRRWVEYLLLAALLLPGVSGIVGAHPYEYTYFNALTGGTEGAQGNYALDYWCTSYREAMGFVNAVAEPGAKVMVMGPLRPAMAFARNDLEVLRNEGDRSVAGVDYLLTCSRWLAVEWGEDARLERVHTVGRGPAVFAEVFRRIKGDPAVDD